MFGSSSLCRLPGMAEAPDKMVSYARMKSIIESEYELKAAESDPRQKSGLVILTFRASWVRLVLSLR